MRDAFEVGKAFRIRYADRRKAILAGFGNSEVDLVGTWMTGMEANMFIVDNRPKERIWVRPTNNAGSVRWESPPGVERSVRVRVTGLLSPAGRYGHVGTFDRQILATKITALPVADEPEVVGGQ